MTEWKTVKLSDLGEIIGGATPATSREDYYNGDIPWITPKDLAGYSGRYISRGERNITQAGLESCSTKLMPKNTILFSSRAPIGYIAIAKNDICTNQGFKSIVPNADMPPLFLYYLLKYYKDEIEAMGSGTTFKEVSGSTMRNITVRIPVAVEIQERIADILDSLDSKIENNNYINNNLLTQAVTLFNHSINGMDKNGCIGDYCSIKSGFAFKSSWWQESGIKVIKIGSINQDNLNLNSCSFVAEDKLSLASDYFVKGGDLLIAMTGATIGKFTMVPFTHELLLVNQRVGKFFLGDEPIRRLPFIYCQLKQTEIYNEIINRGQGSAQPNISADDIMSIPCVIPSDVDIDMFNTSTYKMFEEIINNQNENQQLSALRDLLLLQFMSGKLDVSNLSI